MPQPIPSFFDEARNAAQGAWALVLGRRDAAQYFDFSQRGLVGSFIAVVLAVAISALSPHPIEASTPPVTIFGVVFLSAIVLAAQFGVIYLVLRQLGRADSYVPFLVVQNWATLFQSILGTVVVVLLGPPMVVDANGLGQLTSGSLPYFALSIAVLVIWVNTGRLIMTLRPLHVAIFIASLLGTALILPVLFGGFAP